MENHKNIVLIGLMGCGKSSVGKLLASRLNMNFIDTDVAIANEHQQSIAEIFEEHGEEYFRSLETEYLLHNEFENTVIATGGGMPCYHDNIQKLNLIGNCYYLDTAIKTLVNRLLNDKERPLLTPQKNQSELYKILEDLENKRLSIYSQAYHKIDCNGKSIDDIVAEIIQNS